MDYVNYIYDEGVRPKTDYPNKLVGYLLKRLKIKKGAKVLDLGCGRGDFTQAFFSMGMETSAVDFSDAITKHYTGINFHRCDFTKEALPFDTSSFDVIFSKSVIEHLYYPEELFSEVRRILKPNGVVITMCPAWEHNYKWFFDDYTHRTPFMKDSLTDFHVLLGFKNVRTEFFKQLPFAWDSKFGYFITELIRMLPVSYFKQHFKLIRFSKETMLLTIAMKNNE